MIFERCASLYCVKEASLGAAIGELAAAALDALILAVEFACPLVALREQRLDLVVALFGLLGGAHWLVCDHQA